MVDENPFPDETEVQTPFPALGADRGDRDSWPWLDGVVVGQVGPDEWQVAVTAPEAAEIDDWNVSSPIVFRDANELRRRRVVSLNPGPAAGELLATLRELVAATGRGNDRADLVMVAEHLPWIQMALYELTGQVADALAPSAPAAAPVSPEQAAARARARTMTLYPPPGERVPNPEQAAGLLRAAAGDTMSLVARLHEACVYLPGESPVIRD